MKKIYLILATPIIVLLGCKGTTPTPAPPVTPTAAKACFTPSKTVFDSGEVISFTNCSTNGVSYLWDFGDGATSQSTDKNPTHVYTGTRAEYAVKLAVFNSANKEVDSILKVNLGHRMFDSVRINAFSTFSANTDMFIQLGPGQDVSHFSATHRVVASLPATFDLSSLNMIIPETVSGALDNNEWKGHIWKYPMTPMITFGGTPTSPIFLSRGVNASPIHVNDNSVDMDFYYHIVN